MNWTSLFNNIDIQNYMCIADLIFLNSNEFYVQR